MSKIVDLYMSLLMPAELSAITERILSIVKPAMSGVTLIQKLISLIEKEVQLLEDVLARKRDSNFTKLLLNRDASRDDAFRAFRDYVKACTLRQNAEISDNAKIVMEILKRNGLTLYNLSYTQQSARLAILFDELDSPENTAVLQQFGAEAWYAELKAAQTAFEETYNQKVTVESGEDYPQLANTKASLGNRLNTLLENISLMAEVDPEKAPEALIEKINTIITDIMTIARARKTRQQNKDEES